MKTVPLVAPLFLAASLSMASEPAHGTIIQFTSQGEAFEGQIYPASDYIVVARLDAEVSNGGFPKATATSIGEAFITASGMRNCTVKTTEFVFTGFYRVHYRC